MVKLLYKYFKDSLDELESDQAMYTGKKPILLRPVEIELCGMSSTRTKGIDFGAKQASRMFVVVVVVVVVVVADFNVGVLSRPGT